ncbi:DUF4328 domain-containing protein [Sciscionella marina]|uniref:DUF4328 domain-containing protein n=1 Tax=Sciscionella marina TaxID=508770 RepID=UPI00036445BB|nr:DUF4328 domain-containing protein [Sciscionella marina]
MTAGANRVRWVASPPPGAGPRRPAVRRRPYTGPPSYPATPRWGFPQLAWRWPTSVPGTAHEPATEESVRVAGRLATLMLLITTVTAALATIAELVRYILLVVSLSAPVPEGLAAFSDTFVISAGLVTVVFAIASLYLVLRWLLPARELGERGRVSARGDGWALACVLIPGWNLIGAFYVLAELEHVACERPPGSRPRPSTATWIWWAAWLASGVLFVLTLVWGLRDSVQAMADGVLLHAVTDAVALVLAYLTARTVTRLTGLLAPLTDGSSPYRRILAVHGAPTSLERAPRPATSPR